MTNLQKPVPENLELLARQVVEGFIIGLHKSPFHGFSVEFAEHRLYNQGDPLRHIDWRVFGRTDKLFIKRFEEETNLRCCIVIDTSSSMQFPVNDREKLSKLQFSCVAAASLLQLLKRQSDAGSLAFFDDSIHYFSDCRSSHQHYRMLINELQRKLEYTSTNSKTNAVEALHLVAEKLHRRSLVVIFSDMMDDAENTDALFESIQHLKYNKHEVILFHLADKTTELDFDFENRPYEFVDMESGERIKLQPAQMKEQYMSAMKQHVADIENKCHQYQIDRVWADLSAPVDELLHAFLVKRNKLM